MDMEEKILYLLINKIDTKIKVTNHLLKNLTMLWFKNLFLNVIKGDKRVFIINGLVKGAIQTNSSRKVLFVSNISDKVV